MKIQLITFSRKFINFKTNDVEPTVQTVKTNDVEPTVQTVK